VQTQFNASHERTGQWPSNSSGAQC